MSSDLYILFVYFGRCEFNKDGCEKNILIVKWV